MGVGAADDGQHGPWMPGASSYVDAAWLTTAFQKGELGRGAQVLDVSFDGFIGTGQAARTARFKLRWSDPRGRPSSVVGKFPSGDADVRAFMFASGSYIKEWLFYDKLAQTVHTRAPRCYVAHFEETEPDFVLIMEDVSGARQGDQLDGLTADQVALVVEQAAGLHAPRFGDESLPALLFGGQPISSNAEAGGFCQPIYESALPEFFERFEHGLDDDVIELIGRVGSHVERWFHGTDTPETLVHQDLRADNLLFGQGPDDPAVVLVDFQSLSLGLGAADLAYLVSGSFRDPEVRAGLETDLVAEYGARMAAAGVEMSDDALWRDYRHGSLWGVIMTVMAASQAERTVRGDAMFLAMAQRHGRQAVDLEALAVLA